MIFITYFATRRVEKFVCGPEGQNYAKFKLIASFLADSKLDFVHGNRLAILRACRNP
jgi:hypothetical protein